MIPNTLQTTPELEKLTISLKYCAIMAEEFLDEGLRQWPLDKQEVFSLLGSIVTETFLKQNLLNEVCNDANTSQKTTLETNLGQETSNYKLQSDGVDLILEYHASSKLVSWSVGQGSSEEQQPSPAISLTKYQTLLTTIPHYGDMLVQLSTAKKNSRENQAEISKLEEELEDLGNMDYQEFDQAYGKYDWDGLSDQELSRKKNFRVSLVVDRLNVKKKHQKTLDAQVDIYRDELVDCFSSFVNYLKEERK